MYLGKLVEVGPTEAVFDSPQHPYTQALLDSIPRSHLTDDERAVTGLDGEVPSPRDPPTGCSFHTRCPRIILPPTVDLDQDAFRTVTNFRYQLARDTERFAEYRVPADADEEASRHVHDLREAFDVGPDLADPDAERAVAGAARSIVTGDYEEALARLDEVFTTVCRAHEPELRETTSEDHRSACFLAYETLPDPAEGADANPE